MSVYQRENGKWYVYVTFPDGKRYRKSAGTKKKAEQYEQRVRAKVIEGKWDIFKSEEITFAEFIEEYLEYSEMSKSATTHSSDKSRIMCHMEPFFGSILLRKITAHMVDEYKHKRVQAGAAPKSINNELLNLSHMLKIAMRWGYVDRNVVTNVDKLRVVRNHARFLSQSEIARLIDAARGSHIYPLILTALHTGMRKSELLNLHWSDIDFEQLTISVSSKDDWHTKNYKARTCQITPVLYNVLKEHEAEQPDPQLRSEFVFTYKGKPIRQDIRKSWRRIIGKTGLQGVTLHTLRHTFASQLVMASVPLRDVQELLGHQNFATTLRYAHLSPDHVKRQVLNLPFAR